MNTRSAMLVWASSMALLGCSETAAVYAPLEITTSSLPGASPHSRYEESLTATGGDGTYSWSVSAGGLPLGLTLGESDGLVHGTPTGQSGGFTVRVTSSDGQSATRELDIEVDLEVMTASLPNAGADLAYHHILTAAGGEGAYAWSVVDGALPAGLALHPLTGEITGTTSATGPHDIVVRVTDGQGATDELPLTLTVSERIATIEWPFTELERDAVPASFVIVLYYNGFYNPPPCVNELTRLPDLIFPQSAIGLSHRYDETSADRFPGFTECMVDGTDQMLALGIEDVSGWGVEESIALDAGAPDLVGRTIDFIQLLVDQFDVRPISGGYQVLIDMRWNVYGR